MTSILALCNHASGDLLKTALRGPAVRGRDVAPGGILRAWSTVIQQETGRPVPFDIIERTREGSRHGQVRRGDGSTCPNTAGQLWLQTTRSVAQSHRSVKGLMHRRHGQGVSGVYSV